MFLCKFNQDILWDQVILDLLIQVFDAISIFLKHPGKEMYAFFLLDNYNLWMMGEINCIINVYF
jgi:hypothetical protein